MKLALPATRCIGHLALAAVLTFVTPSWGQTVHAFPKNANGIYKVGEPMMWKLTAKGETAEQIAMPYRVKKNMLTVLQEGEVDPSKGPMPFEAVLDEPGTVTVEMKLKPDDKDYTTVSGAVVAPDQIKPSAPRPDDFDAFWAGKIDALKQIPMNVVIEPADGGKPMVEYFKVQLDNVNGTHVYGQLAKPKKPGKFPALLLVQYAGVYALPKTNVIPRAEQGFLTLNIMAHDLPFDMPPEFYKEKGDNALKGYVSIGNDDREKSYFLRMYLGCVRAAEYLTTRDDWDGKTLVVYGGSQGGQQALVTAGLVPQVSAVLANVPAGCDATGPLHGRMSGFPYWRGWGKEPNQPAMQVGRYFDVVNFASRIKAPALVGYGLLDTTCPPVGVAAAINEIPGKTESIIMVDAPHQGQGGTQQAFYARAEAWLSAIAKGKTP